MRGMHRNLWLEFAPFGRVPLSRKQIDANVLKFQPLSESQMLVLGTDRKLWLESVLSAMRHCHENRSPKMSVLTSC